MISEARVGPVVPAAAVQPTSAPPQEGALFTIHTLNRKRRIKCQEQ